MVSLAHSLPNDAFTPAGEGALRSPSGQRPIDLVHLARQTAGDRSLEREVLGLFVRHLQLVGVRLETAGGLELRQIAHTLKGACRNVGAFPLADAAEASERSGFDAASLAALRAEVDETLGFVTGLAR